MDVGRFLWMTDDEGLEAPLVNRFDICGER
jgi:hypothetical protein